MKYIPTDKLNPGDILSIGASNQFKYEVIEDIDEYKVKVKQLAKKIDEQTTSIMNKGVFIGSLLERHNPFI